MSDDKSSDEFLRKALEETCPEGQVVTHWVMILETFDGKEQNLQMASSESVTPWMALGMIAAAKRIINDGDLDD